jgi:hypothetical protein
MSAHHIWVEPFLEALTLDPCVKDACANLKITVGAVYQRRVRDPEFAKRMDQARHAYTDRLEDSVRERALNGTPRPVYDKLGNVVGEVVEWDNRLSLRVLERYKPEYRQNSGVEMSGSLSLSSMSDAELNAEIARLQKQLASDAADDPSADIA